MAEEVKDTLCSSLRSQMHATTDRAFFIRLHALHSTSDCAWWMAAPASRRARASCMSAALRLWRQRRGLSGAEGEG